MDEGLQSLSINGTLVPTASLATHLSNPVMHKRAPVSQAIADVRATVRQIFLEYLDSRGFNQFERPCLLGAASESCANVFDLPSFSKDAFLAILQADRDRRRKEGGLLHWSRVSSREF